MKRGFGWSAASAGSPAPAPAAAPTDAAGDVFHLSLLSHTNAGKTTLARTLLRRDVGEVRDEAHVTETVDRHTLIETSEGDRLELWDTPGFGDSLRLAKRLAQAGNPLGWFLGEVWDRWRDRPFWSGQRALRHAIEQSDVALYLVNVAEAAEAPDDAGALDAELRILGLVGKPVVALLNQLGPPRSAEDEAAEVTRWRERLRGAAVVREVLPLDAFARCWVQEGALLAAVSRALPAGRRPAFARIEAAWRARGETVWREAIGVLAEALADTALDVEEAAPGGLVGKLRDVGAALGWRPGGAAPREQAMERLGERLDARLRSATDRVIRLHGLEGRAAEAARVSVAEPFLAREPLGEGKAALWGGMATGALAGLKADVLSGGLTLGGGLLAGGLAGALGGLGAARAVNAVRGIDRPALAWSEAMLDQLFQSTLLAYLAVAHFGRGRGQWQATETPAFWRDAASAALADRRESLHRVWRRRKPGHRDDAGERRGFAADLTTPMLEASERMLRTLFPPPPAARETASDAGASRSAAS